MKNCPRFSGCSVPNCPLNPENDKSFRLKGEQKCKLKRSLRISLGSVLPWKGLSKHELAWKMTWEKMSQKNRREYAFRMAKIGVKTQFIRRVQKCNGKDDINPTSKNNVDFTAGNLNKICN